MLKKINSTKIDKEMINTRKTQFKWSKGRKDWQIKLESFGGKSRISYSKLFKGLVRWNSLLIPGHDIWKLVFGSFQPLAFSISTPSAGDTRSITQSDRCHSSAVVQWETAELVVRVWSWHFRVSWTVKTSFHRNVSLACVNLYFPLTHCSSLLIIKWISYQCHHQGRHQFLLLSIEIIIITIIIILAILSILRRLEQFIMTSPRH